MSVRLVTQDGKIIEGIENFRQPQTGAGLMNIKERSFLFKAFNPSSKYYAQIQFFGDMYDSESKDNECAYFNMYLSV
jgi:hypothetical protein